MKSSVALFALLLIVAVAVPVIAASPEIDWLEGVAVLKIESRLYVEINGQENVTELGIEVLDDYFSEISVTKITRYFPTAQPPTPGGVDIRPVYRLEYAASVPVPEVCENLEKLSGVVYACPSHIYQVQYDYNDPQHGSQYNMAMIHASEAHDTTAGDRRVVVAISDTGIMANHPDLAANLWINPGEDVNGNGILDDGDRNNRDDDNNGKVDDLYGWDLVQNDNTPQDTYGHGTHVAGIASAVTNNEVGISSVGNQISIMVVRCGTGPGITQGIPSIVWAVDAGADVINCSWGGYSSDPAGRDAATYANNHDVLIVAAAGNNNTGRVMFPAGYNYVMSVAATDRNDNKAGFSNYGNTIDISAPGVGILSTTFDGSYANMDGTSMASPLVAGAAALFRSYYPDYSAEVVQNFLKFSADDIHEQNGAMADQMGGGRLNIAAAFELVYQPLLVYGGARLASDQNRNGRLDPGERATIVATLSNYSHAPDSIIVRLTTDDNDIEITAGEIRFPNIGTGESYTNDDEPFEFTIADGCTPHTTRFYITVDAQPGDFHVEETIPMLIGVPNVMIVDDDGGLDYELYTQRSVEAMHQGWLSWDTYVNDPPEPDTMLGFRMVIWMTGDASSPLDDQERWAMEQVVQRGGNLLLTGKFVGDDFLNNHFLMNAFGAAHLWDSTTATTAIAGRGRNCPLEQDVVMNLVGYGGSGDANISPSVCRPYRPADTLAIYMNEDQFAGVAGTFRDDPDTYAKSAYLGFTFEGISDDGTHREVVLEQLLSWMAPDLAAPLDRKVTPLEFNLGEIYPNPFNSMLTLNYRLGAPNPFRIAVFDNNGREISVLDQGNGIPGDHATIWNAAAVPSGVYFVRLESLNAGAIQKRVVLVK